MAVMVVPAVTDETASAVENESSVQFVPTKGSGAGGIIRANERIVMPVASAMVRVSFPAMTDEALPSIIR